MACRSFSYSGHAPSNIADLAQTIVSYNSEIMIEAKLAPIQWPIIEIAGEHQRECSAGGFTVFCVLSFSRSQKVRPHVVAQLSRRIALFRRKPRQRRPICIFNVAQLLRAELLVRACRNHCAIDGVVSAPC